MKELSGHEEQKVMVQFKQETPVLLVDLDFQQTQVWWLPGWNGQHGLITPK